MKFIRPRVPLGLTYVAVRMVPLAAAAEPPCARRFDLRSSYTVMCPCWDDIGIPGFNVLAYVGPTVRLSELVALVRISCWLEPAK